MPIQIGDKTFEDFDEAVAYIMRTKQLDRKRASAYVARIERKENEPVRYQPTR